MDVGFQKAGFKILWANDFDKHACATYKANHPHSKIECGSITEKKLSLYPYSGNVDLVFGGPPCQGFSVAGKMMPDDPRSKLIWEFLDVVKIVRPKVFVCENVKALGVLQKWAPIRNEFKERAKRLGYSCDFIILNSADFGAAQLRERVFFIGSRTNEVENLKSHFEKLRQPTVSVRKAIEHLGRVGSKGNARECFAKITLAKHPVMRSSPYAGMIFNGAGRPINLEMPGPTLPASMGGNKTPIIDEHALHLKKKPWVERYHAILKKGCVEIEKQIVPTYLRRLTIDEAAAIQTFPLKYVFSGEKSVVFRQIGNAVPPALAYAVARVAKKFI